MNPVNKIWPPTETPSEHPQPSSDVVARAEAALQALAGQFSRWLEDEIEKLDAVRERIGAEGLAGEAGEDLYTHAHDLKGLGGTYGFPIVTRIAGSLCMLVEDPDRRTLAPLALIESHIEAIKIMVRENIREDIHPMGGAMAASLENQVYAGR